MDRMNTMTLLYHKWLEADVAEAVPSSCFREVHMSWTHVDATTNETALVLLLLAAPTAAPAELTNNMSGFALKTVLFTHAADEVDRVEVCSALFEFPNTPLPSVMSGTGGLFFTTARQCMLLTNAADGCVDWFVVTEGKSEAKVLTWQREAARMRLLEDIPPLRQALSLEERGVLLLTRVASSSTRREEECDVLLVACAADAAWTAGNANRKRKETGREKMPSYGASSLADSLDGTHTFVVALLRCTVSTMSVSSSSRTSSTSPVLPQWELKHLFVDRAIPFRRYMNAFTVATSTNKWESASNNNVHGTFFNPQECVWCFTPHSDNNGGVVFAIIPNPSRVVSIVSGGFDSMSGLYRLGLVPQSRQYTAHTTAVTTTTSTALATGVGEEMESPEETLWSLSTDTQTVQMVLAGHPLDALGDGDAGKGNSGACSDHVRAAAQNLQRHRTGWLNQTGIVTVLRLVVDFIIDGISAHGEAPKRQGLYTTVCSPWEAVAHSRLPLPRQLCWRGADPLPLGFAAIGALCSGFSGVGGRSTSSFGTATSEALDLTVGLPQGDEDPTMWYNLLPTCIASAVPLRCVVSVNAMLKRTRLTYLIKNEERGKSGTSHAWSLSNFLHVNPSNEQNAVNDVALAESMARLASQNDDHLLPETVEGIMNNLTPSDVIRAAWRRVALGRHASIAMTALNSQKIEEPLGDGLHILKGNVEVQDLGKSLLDFLTAFMVELDWVSGTERATLLRDVTLFILGATDTTVNSRHDETAILQLLTTMELRAVQELVRTHDTWRLYAAALFAWVNRNPTQLREENGGTDILLEDVTSALTHENGAELQVILQKLQVVQDAKSYQASISALLSSGSLRPADVVDLACWPCSTTGSDPSVKLVQLFLHVAASASVLDRLTPTLEKVEAMIREIVQLRFPPSGMVEMSVLQLLPQWSFAFLRQWPLAQMGGALAIASLIHFLITQWCAQKEALLGETCAEQVANPDKVHVVEVDAETVLPPRPTSPTTTTTSLMEAGRMLCWLCGESEVRAESIMRSLQAAGVSLMELATCRSAACSRALHHHFVFPAAAVLTDALMDSAPKSGGIHENERRVCALWAALLECDESAAFNPNLLQRLLEALRTRQDRDAGLFLELLRPVFMNVLPRLLETIGDDTDSVAACLAIRGNHLTGPEVFLAPPLEWDSITSVWQHTVQRIKELVALYEAESLEVHCLSQLFRVFRLSCAAVLESTNNTHRMPHTTSSARVQRPPDYKDRKNALDHGQVIFTLSPSEMYFVALQVLRDETTNFILTAEVLRRSLRPFLRHRMEYFLHDQFLCCKNEQLKGNERESTESASRAYLNGTAVDLEMILSAFENTAPLYAHTLLILFLDESLTFVLCNHETWDTEILYGHQHDPDNDDNDHDSTERNLFSTAMQQDMMHCVKRAAKVEWTKLELQEKRLLTRILSDCMMRTMEVEEEEEEEEADSHVLKHNSYIQSESHQRALRDANRLKETLRERTIDPELYYAVKESFGMNTQQKTAAIAEARTTASTLLSEEVPSAVSSRAATRSADVILLFKEEAYVRRCLVENLCHAYEGFTASHGFHKSLGILYLALREENRRRVLVMYAIQQKDMIFTFEYAFQALTCEACRLGAEAQWQRELESFQKRMRFLFLQERESRSAIEAVYHFEKETMLHHARSQRHLFREESETRHAFMEAEDVQRDNLYELCAKSEVEALQKQTSREEEERWKQEESQWAEMQEEPDEHTTLAKKTKGNAFLKWQERHLATNQNLSSPLSSSQAIPSASPKHTVRATIAAIPATDVARDETELRKGTLATIEGQRMSPLSNKTAAPPAPHYMHPGNPPVPVKDASTRERSRQPPPSRAEEAVPIARALAPLLGGDSSASSSSGGIMGYSAFPAKLGESSESIMSTLSWWHKQIISTVAPPPSHQASKLSSHPDSGEELDKKDHVKKEQTEQCQERRDEEDMFLSHHLYYKTASASRPVKDKWEHDDFDEVKTEKRDEHAMQIMESRDETKPAINKTTPLTSETRRTSLSKGTKLSFHSKEGLQMSKEEGRQGFAAKPRPPRRRGLGDVVSLNENVAETQGKAAAAPATDPVRVVNDAKQDGGETAKHTSQESIAPSTEISSSPMVHAPTPPQSSWTTSTKGKQQTQMQKEHKKPPAEVEEGWADETFEGVPIPHMTSATAELDPSDWSIENEKEETDLIVSLDAPKQAAQVIKADQPFHKDEENEEKVHVMPSIPMLSAEQVSGILHEEERIRLALFSDEVFARGTLVRDFLMSL